MATAACNVVECEEIQSRETGGRTLKDYPASDRHRVANGTATGSILDNYRALVG